MYLLSTLELNGMGLNECEANHLALPIESFWIEGVNGRHLCLILPLLGDPIYKKSFRDSPDSFKMIFRQVGKALRFLHRQGICHGDITPRNILFRLEDTTRINREEMLNLVGVPEIEHVGTFTGEKPSPRYPPYIVGPADLSQLRSTGDISVIDWGECFNVSNPPEFIGTPNAYSAPEVRFQFNPGFSGDVWALACTLIEVRTRSAMFDNTTSVGELVACFSVFLGPLPEPYRSVRIKQLREMLEEVGEGDDPGSLRLKKSAEEQLEELSGKLLEREDTIGFKRALARRREKTGYENPLLASMAVEWFSTESPRGPDGKIDEHATPIKQRWKLEKDEFASLGDLLTKTFKYDPKDRLSLDEFLDHPWFETAKQDNPCIHTGISVETTGTNQCRTEIEADDP